MAAAQSGLALAPGPDDPAVRPLIPLPPGWRVATERAAGLPGHSADAALLMTLPPGAYTALVSPDDGGQGVALIEVDEVR